MKNEENTALHVSYAARVEELLKDCQITKMKVLPSVTP